MYGSPPQHTVAAGRCCGHHRLQQQTAACQGQISPPQAGFAPQLLTTQHHKLHAAPANMGASRNASQRVTNYQPSRLQGQRQVGAQSSCTLCMLAACSAALTTSCLPQPPPGGGYLQCLLPKNPSFRTSSPPCCLWAQGELAHHPQQPRVRKGLIVKAPEHCTCTYTDTEQQQQQQWQGRVHMET